jgi:DNA modification methylase
MIVNADSYQYLDTMPENSVDTVITDPPYGLKFMGKKWDYDIPRKDFWEKVYRVCKPGATMLIFGGTRTYHRLAVEIEDAGFEIRDCIMWLYGQGFPKSHDISKAIDKHLGNEREVTGTKRGHVNSSGNYDDDNYKWEPVYSAKDKPSSEQAQEWDGWGTALKPAWEPIIVAMKPIEGTYAENALKYGVAGLNIDGSRIKTTEDLGRANNDTATWGTYGSGNNSQYGKPIENQGRFPANLILDEDSAALLDKQSGDRKSAGKYTQSIEDDNTREFDTTDQISVKLPTSIYKNWYANEKGGASRFFYVAKASRSERDYGLDETVSIGHRAYGDYKGTEDHGTNMTETHVKNNHPTVKPIALLEYLCKLTETPTSGVILDPFMGSGSLGIAAHNTGRKYIGIEIDESYFKTAEKRIEAWKSRSQ